MVARRCPDGRVEEFVPGHGAHPPVRWNSSANLCGRSDSEAAPSPAARPAMVPPDSDNRITLLRAGAGEGRNDPGLTFNMRGPGRPANTRLVGPGVAHGRLRPRPMLRCMLDPTALSKQFSGERRGACRQRRVGVPRPHLSGATAPVARRFPPSIHLPRSGDAMDDSATDRPASAAPAPDADEPDGNTPGSNEPDLFPVRMLNEYVYCARLFHFQARRRPSNTKAPALSPSGTTPLSRHSHALSGLP